MSSSDLVTLDLAVLEPLLAARLEAAGQCEDEAALIARILCDAEMCGVSTHGLLRLPWYVEALESGRVQPYAERPLLVDHEGVAVLDGGSAYGYLPTWRAVALASHRARSFGVALVAVRHCSEFGRAAPYVDELAREGLAGIVCQNTAPLVAAPGSDLAVVGNNPLGFGAPGRHGVRYDGACTVRSGGELHRRHLLGLEVPEEWGYTDAQGHPTTDPARAMTTAQQAAGGIKGFGTALLVDLLAGALSGSAHGPSPAPRSPSVGATVVAIDPQRLGLDADAFTRGYAALHGAVADSGGAWPGSRSRQRRTAARADGTVRVAAGIVRPCRESIGEAFDAAVRP